MVRWRNASAGGCLGRDDLPCCCLLFPVERLQCCRLIEATMRDSGANINS